MMKQSNKDPVAKAVRTPQFRIRIVKSKKVYNRKKLNKGDY